MFICGWIAVWYFAAFIFFHGKCVLCYVVVIAMMYVDSCNKITSEHKIKMFYSESCAIISERIRQGTKHSQTQIYCSIAHLMLTFYLSASEKSALERTGTLWPHHQCIAESVSYLIFLKDARERKRETHFTIEESPKPNIKANCLIPKLYVSRPKQVSDDNDDITDVNIYDAIISSWPQPFRELVKTTRHK